MDWVWLQSDDRKHVLDLYLQCPRNETWAFEFNIDSGGNNNNRLLVYCEDNDEWWGFYIYNTVCDS